MRATYRHSWGRFEQEVDSSGDRDRLEILFPDDSVQFPDQHFVCRRPDPAVLILQGDSQFALRFEDEGALGDFLANEMPTLADLASYCGSERPGETVLYATGNDTHIWLSCVYEDKHRWLGCAVRRPRFEDESDGVPAWPEIASFCASPNERRANKLWDRLVDSSRGLALPPDFPALMAELPSAGYERRMTVKLGPSVQWLVLMPFDLIARRRAGPMACIKEIEWIVTTKSLVKSAAERAEMIRDLSDVACLISHTVVILNDYGHHDADCHRATWLMTEILSLLSRVDLQLGGHIEAKTLRCIRNPTAGQLKAVLRSADTWYLFAGFHVEDGCWQLGGDGGTFAFDWLADGDLSHIRMLRAYHCNSVFDPEQPVFSGHSINARLLRAGARRVEGSTLRETHFTYIAHLLAVLCSSPGMQLLLHGASMERGKDLPAMLNDLSHLIHGSGGAATLQKEAS